MNRRHYLATAAATLTLAGCLGETNADAAASTGTGDGNDGNDNETHDGTIGRIEGDLLVVLADESVNQYHYPADDVAFDPREGQQVRVSVNDGEATDVELHDEQRTPRQYPGRRPDDE